MGSGLFIVISLLALSARAETPVGLDARGVDPLAAVDNRHGLDVRDELGRPVTAQAVLRDIKKAAVARVAQTAFFSNLPKAGVILPTLELAIGLGLRLAQFAATFPAAAVSSSLPGARPKILFLLILSALAIVAHRRAAARARPCPVSFRRGRCRPEVLLC